MAHRRSLRSRLTAVASVVALTISGLMLSAAIAPAASATPGPVQELGDNTVTADPLPTVQMDGVVWSQAIVGNTVYAGGKFANARPAGAAAGTNLTPRGNLLAYDLTTGNLITSFAPVLNGQVRTVVASPDGKRVYVGGDFTTVNGASRSRIVAFNTSDGSVVTNFLATLDYNVYSITVSADSSKVYVGGDFNSARGVARKKLAAFNANGDLLGWNPGADARVNAVLLTPDGSKVIAGGAFANAAGKANYGMAAIDANSGASMTWKVTSLVRDAGPNSAILGLSTDGTAIYANGYVYGSGGNLEGVTSVQPGDGTINWIEDCHGDSYGTYAPTGANAVYVVSHAHYCGNVGGHPQTDPWTFQRGMAFTKNVTGTLNPDPLGYYNFGGNPSPSILGWFPELAMGSYTGQYQAAWTVTGNDKYVVLGGEFPRVNGVGQQGLVRFAVRSISKGTKPIYSGANLVPTLQSMGGGAVRATFQANWDRDDTTLTYQLLRNGQVVNTATANSTFWNRPNLTISDSGLTSGTTYTYQIKTVDPSGNTAVGNQVSFTATATSTPPSAYSQLVAQQGANAYWRLGEASGTFFDYAGTDDGTGASGVSRGVAGAIAGDSNTAAGFNGTDNGRMSTKNSIAGPNTFSAEAWIKATTTSGGKILGFGSSATGTSSSYDRHIYMDNSGKIYFGAYPNAVKTVNSPNAYNDGQWHQVVATLGSSGMTLYVDGAKVAQDPSVTSAQAYNGYWRLGGDNLDAWTAKPSSRNFNGAIDEVSIYPTVLTDQQVQDQFKAAGGQLPNVAPTAAFTSSTAGSTVNFDGTGSTDSDGTVASYAWDFGDKATGTGGKPSHTYAAAGTYTVKLTVTDDRGGTNTVSHQVTIAANQPPVAQFTVTVNNLDLTVDGSTSSDPDGTVASYSWDFGDGTTATGVTPPKHTYASAATRPVTLTVTDNAGATNSQTQQVTTTNPPVNKPPVASFTTSVNGLAVSVDGTASSDPDGTVASYSWDFGDGSTGTGQTASRTYAKSGTYSIKLTVTDDKGATGVTTNSVTVTAPPPPNQDPVAAFTATPTNLSVAFDASTSKDPDGTITGYAWDFGDATTGTGKTATHVYAAAGSYQVTLTVTDNGSATNSKTSSVTVTAAPPANQPPVAAFTATPTNLDVAFDASTSKDSDGSIASYAWDFGDGATGTGVNTTHTYQKADTYQVKLTVTDDKGASTSITKPVVAAQGPNQSPTAAFTSTTANLDATFDASTSKDPDGTIASYAWDFGDGATGSGINPTHSYGAAGTFQVKLTVTDNNGASTSVTNPVTVAPAPPAVFASDEFGRTVASGWGTADQGGPWTLDGNTANYAVGAGVGTIKMATAGSGKGVWLNSVSQADVDTTVDVKLDKAATGGGTTASIAERRNATNDYRLRVRAQAGGAVSAELTKVVGGTETMLASQTIAGLSYNAGDTLRLRFQVTGSSPTTLQGKVWKVGGTEPTTWQVTKTDSTAEVQGAGGIGLVTYLSGSATNAPVTASFDNLTVTAVK